MRVLELYEVSWINMEVNGVAFTEATMLALPKGAPTDAAVRHVLDTHGATSLDGLRRTGVVFVPSEEVSS